MKEHDAHNARVAFAIHSASSSHHEKSLCSNCGRAGHEVSSCLKIISYPKWWNDGRGHGKGNGRGNGGTTSPIMKCSRALLVLLTMLN